MKKFAFLIIFILAFSYMHHALADDVNPTSDPNWGVPSENENTHNDDYSKSGEDEWDKIYDQTIYNKYGSDQSPAFLNRDNMNPGESDYGYSSD